MVALGVSGLAFERGHYLRRDANYNKLSPFRAGHFGRRIPARLPRRVSAIVIVIVVVVVVVVDGNQATALTRPVPNDPREEPSIPDGS